MDGIERRDLLSLASLFPLTMLARFELTAPGGGSGAAVPFETVPDSTEAV